MKILLACSVSDDLFEFRIPELQSIADYFGFKIIFEEEVPDVHRPYMIVHLDSEKEARLLGSRSIVVKHIWEYYADAETYDELHEKNKRLEHLWSPIASSSSTSWKFMVSSWGGTVGLERQLEVINQFRYMAMQGPVRIKNPDFELGIFEEYYDTGNSAMNDKKGQVRRIFMGRKICDTQRFMIDKFDLKKRKYIGTTSMEAEVSLIMANQAHAGIGKLVYDPFAGTGSMLLTCSAFGSLSFGSDIDGRQIRGKGSSIRDNAKQYGVSNRLVDVASFDMTQHPFRRGELFDAIVTDPPYGVRAGAKRLGRKENRAKEYKGDILVPGREHEGFSHQLPDYVSPSIPWEMTEVINTLISFSDYLLKPGGRLVYFLPTDNAEYSDVDVPVVEGFKLISNTSQNFGKWARRLITMEKEKRSDDQDCLRRPMESEFGQDGKLDRGIERLEWGKERGAKGGHTGAVNSVYVSPETGINQLSLETPVTKKVPGHANFRERFFDIKARGRTVINNTPQHPGDDGNR